MSEIPDLPGRAERRRGPSTVPTHQAGEAFAEAHADASDALWPQPDRRGQHEVGAIGLQQIDRADIRRELALNQLDDVGGGAGICTRVRKYILA